MKSHNAQFSEADSESWIADSRGPRLRAQRGVAMMVLSLVALTLVGCERAHTPAGTTNADLPSAGVRLETVQARMLPVTHDVVGTVRSRNAADIAAKISGRIVELPVILGQAVQSGDLLAVIDSQETQARLEQAEVALRQVEIDYQRVEKLRETGAVTASEYDALNSRLHSARAAVVEAQVQVGDARITAPLTGVVARKHADPGDLAMPGRPLLRVEDPRHLRLEADVPGSLLDRVMPGAAFTVQVDGVRAPFEAKVAEISPVADPATRTLRVKLDLPPTEGLRPGQFGRVSIPVGEAECLMVPLTALVSRGQMEILFSVKEGKAQLRIVRTGRRLADGVEIIAGLTSGETIVVENAAALVDGQPLSPL